jgi:hypothetical protein
MERAFAIGRWRYPRFLEFEKAVMKDLVQIQKQLYTISKNNGA